MRAPLIEANGAAIPAIGLGTWQGRGESCVHAVKSALECGYAHIDTAARYDNEREVGEGLRASGRARDSYFVTTKVWYTDIADGPLQRSAEASLTRLGLDAVDLLLVHWPNGDIPLADTLRALCEARRRGLARHVGVSNFPVRLLDEAVTRATEPLVANQCEYHPYLDQSRVAEACRRHGMAFISYSPFGSGTLLDEPVIRKIATRLGRSPAQVVLRWHLQQPGIAAIPRSGHPGRIAQNLDVLDFELDAHDMVAIFALARAQGRVINPEWAPQWD
jgi:diketogulonate reductase-like aldo/keto reductase